MNTIMYFRAGAHPISYKQTVFKTKIEKEMSHD